MTRPHLVPILMTVGAALLWSSSFTVAKAGLKFIDPYTFVLLRFLVAGAVLVVAALLMSSAALICFGHSGETDYLSWALGLSGLVAAFMLGVRLLIGR